MKKQLDEEVQHLTNSYQNLKQAQQKFRECLINIKSGVAESTKGAYRKGANRQGLPSPSRGRVVADFVTTGKTILVPLTSSLYVPGKLADTEHVLVDVGTGFYVEKTTEDARKFYDGKIEELGSNIKELETIVNGKANNLRMVEEVLRQKMLTQGPSTNAPAK